MAIIALGGILQITTANAAPRKSHGRNHQPNPTPTPTSTPSLTPTPASSPSPSSTPTSIPTPSPTAQALIGIYNDQACTAALSSLNWGALSPGTTSTLILYINNQGNTAVTLSKALSNYNPSTLSSYLTLNWDYTNQTITPGTTLKVTLSLTVSPSISGIINFGFNTTITATG